jgi:hypothetical protein
MAKLTRYPQNIFGSTAGANRISKFGSLAAGSPVAFSGATITPAQVQALANFLTGLDGSLVAGSTTPIQDENALHYLWSYQLAYVLQQGIPEYDATTTYFTNGFASYNGTIYQSTADNNTGNTPSGGSQWAVFQYARKSPTRQTITASGSATYTTPAGCTRIHVKAMGGGGGGGGGATSGTGGNGGSGSATTFGATLLVANGGVGGTGAGAGGAGGTGSVSGGVLGFAVSGGDGASAIGTGQLGGIGGSGALGGAGKSGIGGGTGAAGKANSGGGGGGAGSTNGSGAGGGAGGYAEGIINSPSATYAVVVGAGGTAGTAGTGGTAGGAGGSGIVDVVEYYD